MKLKRIRVSPEFLLGLLRGDYRHFTTEPKLPMDMKIIDILRTVDPCNAYNTFDVIVESEEFEELNEGTSIPDIVLTCTDIPTVKLFVVDKSGKKIKIVVEGVTDH